MQDKFTLDYSFIDSYKLKQKTTEFGRHGIQVKTGAPVTGAVTINGSVAACFGDGSVRFFNSENSPITVKAHRGVVLSLASDNDHLFTGGDDGRFLRLTTTGEIEEIADFGTRWVDCVAAGYRTHACSAGHKVFVWSDGQPRSTELEHSSTIGGLAFDAKGERLAVSHYGGVTIWEKKKSRWKRSRLVWKGSHNATTFSPDGKYLVTAMQENCLHGWRIRDKANLSMDGYPAKIKSFAWVGATPYLVTSGAHEAICWPFDGKDGPMNRRPLCVADGGEHLATCVQSLPIEHAVVSGFKDGSVRLAELDEQKNAILLRGTTGIEVTALAVTASGSHILIGDQEGNILWSPLH